MAEKLAGDTRTAALSRLPGWSEAAGRDAIARSFTFRDFREAFAFMSRVAEVADARDHHP